MSIRKGLAFLMRTSFRRILLCVLALFVIPIAGFGVWISQPLFSAGGPATVTVAPEVLKAHARILSVDFAPRSYRNKYNITLCAENVSAVLCLEMIGYFTGAPSTQSYPMPVLK